MNLATPKLFLAFDANNLSQERLRLFLKKNLIASHEDHFGIWLECPLDLESLKLKIAFLESLLKKISPEYTKALNPIKLNIYFESI